jgi:phosphatidyl-myo-inositol dimannoside synthase
MTASRVIIVTTGLGGADGVSELTRQWVEAFACPTDARGRRGGAEASQPEIEIWSLTDRTRPACIPSHMTFRTAAGSKSRFIRMALFSAYRVDERTLVAVLHVHLLPALLPLMLCGARALTVLLGIEVWKPLRALEAFALRRAWRVTAISAYTIGRFREANPALADVAVSVCHPRVAAAVQPANPASVSHGAFVASRLRGPFALIVGRMSSSERYKGHDVLLDVWPTVCARAAEATLVIAGGGDDVERLRQRAADARLGDRVVFTGPVADDHLAALYRDAAFFVMPSAGEGFGLVYLEAMRAGKPCIASPGAAAEIIEDGVHGLIVEPGDRDAVTAAIVRLFVDQPLRQRLGAAAAARVDERFTPERFAARLSELLPC